MRVPQSGTATLCLVMTALGTMVGLPVHAVRGQNAKEKAPAKKEVVDDKTIRALIVQLGDDVFDRREAASKRLADIGEPARMFLEQAAKESTDAEVRERARLLVEAIITRAFVEVRSFKPPDWNGTWITRLAVTPDGRRALAAGFGPLRSWNLAVPGRSPAPPGGASSNGQQMIVFQSPSAAYCWGMAIAPDGRRVIAGGDDHVARVFDLNTGKMLRELQGHTAAVWGVALLADGKRAVTGGWDKSLRLWDVDGGKEIRTFANVPDNVRCLAVSPDGKLLAAGHFAVQDGPATLRLWDLAGKQVRAFEGHTREITSVAFSPDGKTLCSSSFDKTVRLWDVKSGKERKRLLGHTHRVESAAFTPDGKRVVSCGDQDDPVVRLWDCASGKQVCQTVQTENGFLSVVALPDGRHCVTGGKDGVVRLWEWKR